MKNKFAYKLLVLSFCLIISFPLLAFCLDLNIEMPLNEKRSLAILPHYTLGGPVKKYISAFDEYFKDNFPFRTALIFVNNYLKFFLFSVSPNSDVVVGRSDMLFFFAKNSGDPLGDFRGLNSFSENELLVIKKNLEKRRDLLKKKNIEFILFLPPNKESVYPENVPALITKYSNRNRLDQLSNFLKMSSDISVVTIKDELVFKKLDKQVYYNTDSHWNQYGSFLAYNKLLDQISRFDNRISIDKLSNYSVETRTKNIRGDLSTLLGLQELLPDIEIEFSSKRKSKQEDVKLIKVKNILENHNLVFESNLKNKPNILFLCDSFLFYGPLDFLKKKFKKSYFIWHSLPNNPKSLENEKINIMVFEVVERYLPMLLKPVTDEKYPWAL